MSVETRPGALLRHWAIVWGVLACAGLVFAADAEAPDLELLEYLGSWQGDDEDWMLFAAAADELNDSQETGDEKAPAPDEETLAEMDDEN